MFPFSAKAVSRLVWIFVAGVLCLHLLFFIHLRQRIQQSSPDFTVFYTGAEVLRDGLGHQLYDAHTQYEVQKSFAVQIPSRRGPLPYIHPPFEALVFLPLTLLPYYQAYIVWDVLNVVMLFGVAWLLRQSVSTLGRFRAWKVVIGSFALFPVFACLLQGQDSILLLLLCTLGFRALKRKQDFAAGCWFALGTFKFQLVIPIVLLFVIWKRKNVGAGFAAVSLVLALISIGLVGWETALRYPAYVLLVAKTPGLGGVPPELLPNLRGLAMGWPGFSKAAGTAAALLGSFLLFLFAAVKRQGSGQPRTLELQFSLAAVVSGLIGWQTNAHDLCLLVPPLVLMGEGWWSAPPELRVRFAALLPVLPLLISPLWIVLWLKLGAVNVMAIPLLWWAWTIGQEFSRDQYSSDGLSLRVQT